MGFRISFNPLETEKEVRELLEFMVPLDLGYKGWNDWLGKVEAELFSGQKRAILGFSEQGLSRQLVSYLIWQGHKTMKSFAEFKSARVHPEFRGRLILPFSLRQAEHEAAQAGYQYAILDARADNTKVLSTLVKSGFEINFSTNLYEPDKRDIVLVKDLRRTE
jgi:ribosomal protein S18 acetylase RimI-like enzyme